MRKIKSFEVSLFKCKTLTKVPLMSKVIEATDVDTARMLGHAELKPQTNTTFPT